jgi:RNA-binding protein
MKMKESHKKKLRGLGHKIKPIVTIGSLGLSESLINEYENSINHHELIKIRFRDHDRSSRNKVLDQLCIRTKSQLISKIGNTALMYRENKESPKIRLLR